MRETSSLFVVVPALLFVGAADAQYPVLDMVAQNVIQKYQQASCEQLWEKKGQPKSPRGAGSHPDAAWQSADGCCIHQPGRRAHRQQDVRMRHDSMSVDARTPPLRDASGATRRTEGSLLVPWPRPLALGVCLGVADAQAQDAQKARPASKSARNTGKAAAPTSSR